MFFFVSAPFSHSEIREFAFPSLLFLHAPPQLHSDPHPSFVLTQEQFLHPPFEHLHVVIFGVSRDSRVNGGVDFEADVWIWLARRN
jgi:hypothetical protein